jgi:hypothetical protein
MKKMYIFGFLFNVKNMMKLDVFGWIKVGNILLKPWDK